MWKISIPALLLAVVSHASTPGETANIVYAHDDAVAKTVDVDAFSRTGEVILLEGIAGGCTTETGPAPAPYPPIRFLGPSFERLGATDAGMDGISFYTRGKHTYWKKNRRVFVVWKIRIPSANERSAADFDGDLTLSLWVDWDQSESWDREELAVRKSFNISDYLPGGDEEIALVYLTCFRVPDTSSSASTNSGPGTRQKNKLTSVWVRGSISYDNPLVSPDGDQLYGEFEDYRVGCTNGSNRGKKGGDND